MLESVGCVTATPSGNRVLYRVKLAMARVILHNVPAPASRFRSATRSVDFLRSGSRCRWYV